MEWLTKNWHVVWALFCLAILALVWFRYRDTAVVQRLMRLWGWASLAAFGLAAVGIGLMLIGTFTVEWTCHCKGSDAWKCVGATCNADASAHFDATKHTVSCSRTDWPMRVLGGVGRLLLPK
jgi:hypothetical protein